MADSAFARFVFDRSLVRADGSVRWKAFLDKRPPHETSVSAHESLRVGIHWDEGAKVNPSRQLLGAADITEENVKSAGLAIRPVPLADMPHHAELTGWPQGDDEDAKLQRIDIATDLADASAYVAKE